MLVAAASVVMGAVAMGTVAMGTVAMGTVASAAAVGAPAAAVTVAANGRTGPDGIAVIGSRLPPQGYAALLTFDVSTIVPVVATAAGPAALRVTGTMTNTGPDVLTGLTYRFQRGPALSNTADLKQELANPSEPVATIEPHFTDLLDQLGPGSSAPFTATVPIAAQDGLAVGAPGVYPVMINVNGAVVLDGGPLEARIGELHLALSVVGVPTGTPAASDSASGAAGRAGTVPPVPVNVLWPLVDWPHLGVGGVFLDDDLATAISPGGRLSTLVDGLTAPGAAHPPDDSITLAIDPGLLDELDRMSRGYLVLADPGTPQPPLTPLPQASETATPTSAHPATANTVAPPAGEPTTAQPTTGRPTATTDTTAPVQLPGTVAGTGQQRAVVFLTRLRGLTSHYPTIVLPAGDPDVVALVRSNMAGGVSAAVAGGRQIATRVLGPAASAHLLTGTSFPINGALDPATLTALTEAGMNSAVLAQASIRLGGPAAGAARVAVAPDQPDKARIPTVISRNDVLAGVSAVLDHGQSAGWALRVNALTALLSQQHFDGGDAPAVFLPERRWSPDADAIRLLTDLLATLGGSQVITGTSLARLAASATAPAELSYPQDAQAAELTPEYLHRVQADQHEVAALRATLGATPQTVDPADVLDPLDQALAPSASASTAFRTDPSVGAANLATVEATTAGIRNGVAISSAGNSYTLASSTSPLVLTLQNNLPYAVPVRVQITGGERVGLTVTDQGVQVIPAARSLQVKIPAEVSRSGQFQVGARLVGPDGTTWGEPVELSVESTAYSAVTVVIIILAGGVLLIMVGLRIWQRLRARRVPGRSESGGAAGSAGRADRGPDPMLARDRVGLAASTASPAASASRASPAASATSASSPPAPPSAPPAALGGVRPEAADPSLRSFIPAPSASAGVPDADQIGTDRS